VLPNFRVIKRYNNSDNYALAVGHLADRIRGGQPFVTPWPLDQVMSQKDREEVQSRLNALGYSAGDVDGMFGPKTRDAIRAFQSRTDTAVDGNYTPDVLDRLRTAK
jgi:membrane-bound lytic murein transglycosylase B